MECTLTELGVKVVLSETLEHSANVIFVVLFVVAEDEDVVQIYDNEDIGHVAEDVVHEMLKGGWGVGHAKGHDEVFE